MSKRSKRERQAASPVLDAAPPRRTWIFAIGIAVVVAITFLPALPNQFVSWDDTRNFLENPHYRGLGTSNLAWMWSTFLLGHFVPLSWMTLGLDYELWGMNAAGYHATSIAIHAMDAALVFLLARRLFRLANAEASPRVTDWAAAFSALAFALHPLRVESVVWITERRDVLSLFFYLTTILAWLRSATVKDHRERFYWASVVLFLCALLSKATAMTVPAVLLLLDIYPLRRLETSSWRRFDSSEVRRAYLEIVPFALLSLGFVVLSIVALHPPPQLPLGGKIAVSAFSLCFYLLKCVLPTGLSPLYEMPQRIDPLSGIYVACYLVAIALIAAVFMLRKRWPGAVAALAGFVLISLPMLGFVQNGPQIAADRYTYHSAPALAMLAGAALFLWPSSWSERLRARGSGSPRSFASQIPGWAPFTVGGLMLAALAFATVNQIHVWRDSAALWSRVVEIDPQSGLGHAGLSSLFFKDDKVAEGLAHARRAVEVSPDLAEARNDLGIGLTRMGSLNEGVAELQRALEIRPTYEEAENNLGVVEAQLGKLSDAMVHYRRAIDLNPDYADARVNIGNLLVREQKPDEAIPHYAEALRIQPDNADAHFNWGVALAQQGKYRDAIAHFSAAVAIRPNFELAKQYIDQATRLDSAKRASPGPSND